MKPDLNQCLEALYTAKRVIFPNIDRLHQCKKTAESECDFCLDLMFIDDLIHRIEKENKNAKPKRRSAKPD